MQAQTEDARATHAHGDSPHGEQSSKRDVRIYVVVESEYYKFDLSGGLPFGIVFHLCRYARTDANDDKPLLFDMSGSVFDVPFALGTGLLRLIDDDAGTEVDLRAMGFNPPPSGPNIYRLDPKPEGHRTRVAQGYAVPIPAGGPLAALLTPGKMYSIRLNRGQLRVSWWAYGDPAELLVDGKPARPSEPANLVASATGTGRALFWTASSLVTPPPVEVRMAWQPPAQEAEGEADRLECVILVSVVNQSQEAVSVQSSGRQRYLYPRSPGHLERDDRTRITGGDGRADKFNFALTRVDTGNVVKLYKPPACSGLTAGNADTRPFRRNFTTLEPGHPLVKRVNVDNMVSHLRLTDGTYRVNLENLGAYWCSGSVSDIFGSSDDSTPLPHELYNRYSRAIWLSCPDTVDIAVVDGKCQAII